MRQLCRMIRNTSQLTPKFRADVANVRAAPMHFDLF